MKPPRQLVFGVILLCLALAAPAIAASAQSFKGRVISVAEGDTITVLTAGKHQEKIRLYGIDCPERGQPFGNQARQATDVAYGKDVIVQPIDKDRYGRTVAVVSAPGQSESLNEILVRYGLAWVYPQFCKDEAICAPLREIEQGARAAKRGLWADKNPVPPWEWRAKNRSK